MTLTIHIGKYWKFLQCPFATWWKARKYFKRPQFKFYFGPMQRRYWYEGSEIFGIKPKYLYEDKGFFYFLSYDYIKWKTSKWFPILMESQDIGWKDKYNTPRYEHSGFFSLIIGRNPKTAWQFAIVVKAPKIYYLKNIRERALISEDSYWESILWCINYYKEYNSTDINIQKAFKNNIDCSYITNWYNLDINDFEINSVIHKGESFIELSKQIDKLEKPFYGVVSNLDSVLLESSNKNIKAYSKYCYIYNNKFYCLFTLKDLKYLDVTNADISSLEFNKVVYHYSEFNELLLTDYGVKHLK